MNVSIIISACVLGLGVLAFLWNITNGIKKTAIDSEKKRSRIYARIDEVKDENKKDFVSKEICTVVHENLIRDIKEIKKDVKQLLSRKTGGA